MRSARVTWLGRERQSVSVTTRVGVPSASTTSSRSSSAVSVPNPSGLRSNPWRPRNHPSLSSASTRFGPGRSTSATGYENTCSRLR